MKLLVYLPLIYILEITLIFCVVIACINYYSGLKYKKTKILDKQDIYESGSKSVRKARDAISSELYVLAVLFLIFDIEILYLLPAMMCYKSATILLGIGFFLAVLGLGFLYEWSEGSFLFLNDTKREVCPNGKGVGRKPNNF